MSWGEELTPEHPRGYATDHYLEQGNISKIPALPCSTEILKISIVTKVMQYKQHIIWDMLVANNLQQ